MDEIDIDVYLLTLSEMMGNRDTNAINEFIQDLPREILIHYIIFLLGAHDAAVAAVGKLMDILKGIDER